VLKEEAKIAWAPLKVTNLIPTHLAKSEVSPHTPIKIRKPFKLHCYRTGCQQHTHTIVIGLINTKFFIITDKELIFKSAYQESFAHTIDTRGQLQYRLLGLSFQAVGCLCFALS